LFLRVFSEGIFVTGPSFAGERILFVCATALKENDDE